MADDTEVKPWEKYGAQAAQSAAAPSNDSPWQTYAAQQPAQAPAQTPVMQPAAPARTPMQNFRRSVGLAARMGLQAAGGTAGMVGDALNTAINMGGEAIGHNPNLGMPSQAIQHGIDAITPTPQGFGEKAGDFIGSMVAGGYGKGVDPLARAITSGIAPAAGKAATVHQQNILDAQRQGYAVPPSQSEGRFLPNLVEGFAGKQALYNKAEARNSAVTNKLVGQAAGMPEGADLGYVNSVIDHTYQQGYEPLKALSKITTGGAYRKALDKVLEDFQGASKDFPGAVDPEVADLVSAFRVPEYSGNGAVAMVKSLRKQANSNYIRGNPELGGARKAIATALEDNIDLNLRNPQSPAYQEALAQGSNPNEMVGNFRDMRKQLAQQYTLAKVYDPGTGSADALKLAAMLRRNKPLTDGLRDAAKFGATAPMVAGIPKMQAIPGSMMGAVPTAIAGMLGGPGAAAATASAPLGRAALRSWLLSPAGQRWAGPHLDPGILTRMSHNQGFLNSLPTGIGQLKNGLYSEEQ